MTTPMRMTFARLCLDTRTMLDITQQALANAVGVSRPYIAAIETGRANPSLDLVERIADRLGIHLDLVAVRPIVTAGRSRGDLVHARCSGYTDRRLRSDAWEVRREVEVVHGRSHGWIDLLAFDPRTGTLLIVEIKTRIDDLGAIERQLGWYEREAVDLALRRFGWRAKNVGAWLIGLASDEVDAAIRSNSDALRVAFPMRAVDMTRVVAGELAPVGRDRGLALIDPSSRRQEWLLKSRSDGRRSAAPYRDYADAARRFGTPNVSPRHQIATGSS
jgi:transcriptional regulator with XRE-family HTH domain